MIIVLLLYIRVIIIVIVIMSLKIKHFINKYIGYVIQNNKYHIMQCCKKNKHNIFYLRN
jgi:hypothetical protein